MATGVKMTEPERIRGGVAFSFPLNDGETSSPESSTKVLPRRLRRRLLLEAKSPPSAEEIDAKLKEANLRRHQFYELISSRARSKLRSPSRPSSQEKVLGQQLEAKLNAAEQKRLSIIAKAQMCLARQDEMRRAAKIGIEMRLKKERDELSMNVESRVQKAEENRMLLLKAHRQRSAAKRERAAQLLMQKMMQESKYKECVRAAILQRRSAAEKKRLGLLEAERKRAHLRILQVLRVTKSVHGQRENERKQAKGQLKDGLQKAKEQRAGYLKQRKNLHGSMQANSKIMYEQVECLFQKVARCWRQFVKLRKTTFALAEAFVTLEINEASVKSMPFELLALKIESAASIRIVKALADRLESRFRISRTITSGPSSLDNIEHLLRHVASPSRRHANNALSGGVKAIESSKKAHQNPVKLSRYPTRIVLCAYMIIGHPHAVFSGKGELEIALYESAAYFSQQFEELIKIITDGYPQAAQGKIASVTPSRKTFRSQLETFDKAWCSYLFRFVSWKDKDAKLLEKDLMSAAQQMELYTMQTHKPNSKGNDGALTHYLKDIKKQAILHNPSGKAGLECMELVIPDAHHEDLEAQKSGSSLQHGNTSSLGPPASPDDNFGAVSGKISGIVEEFESPMPEIQSSLEKEVLSPRVDSQSSRSTTDLSSGVTLFSENEMLVNEIIHDHHHDIADSLVIGDKDQNNLKAKVREAMEKAFWDAVIESMKQDEPDLSWILKLMKEVRDELCEMSPQSLRQEILETIDIDIVSQVLTSGISDMDFLGKILEFSLVTLQKLSAPANDDEIRATHLKLFKELAETSQDVNKSEASFAILMVKGLRFVLQQIQNLKKEISKAHLRMVEPAIKGPAGLEYLKNSFTRRYGSPVDAPTSLPLTKQWLSSIRIDVEQEWDEHIDSLSALTISSAGFSQVVPSTTLRTGGRTLTASSLDSVTSPATGNEQPECMGETIDKLVRLGLLKLVSEVGGLALENVPETLKLNFLRLRSVQSQLQKIIAISTSMLVLRQALLSENLVASSVDMEDIICRGSEKLLNLLDNVEDAGIAEIIDAICATSESNNHLLDAEKLQSRKQVMASMLGKSMQAGDAIFTRVSHTTYLAARGAVFGGSGVKGRKLVEAALRRIGASPLIDKVVKAAKVLVVVAVISCRVHGDWYEYLLKNVKPTPAHG